MTEIALITGGNRGIGMAAARLLARTMTVVIGARDDARGRLAEADLRGEGLNARYMPLDVTDQESIEAAADWIAKEHGVLDVLVNNAGIATGGLGEAPSGASVTALRRAFETNVVGVVSVTNAFLPLLRKAKRARIVNVSSEVGSITRMTTPDSPLWSMTSMPYPVSKTALNMVTALYAKELRDLGIKVNAANPGYCATDLGREDRSDTTRKRGDLDPQMRSAEQGAEVVAHLAALPDDGPTGILWGDDSFTDGHARARPYTTLPW